MGHLSCSCRPRPSPCPGLARIGSGWKCSISISMKIYDSTMIFNHSTKPETSAKRISQALWRGWESLYYKTWTLIQWELKIDNVKRRNQFTRRGAPPTRSIDFIIHFLPGIPYNTSRESSGSLTPKPTTTGWPTRVMPENTAHHEGSRVR